MADEKDKKTAEDENEGLLAVIKDGVTIYVNPLTLKQHQDIGWKLVD